MPQIICGGISENWHKPYFLIGISKTHLRKAGWAARPWRRFIDPDKLELMSKITESDIKQGILHPQRFVRCACAEYFTTTHSDDASIQPLVIQAIETYGWNDAFGPVFTPFANLVQTDETLLWFLAQLEKTGAPAGRLEHYHRLRIATAIAASRDANLLQRHYQRIGRLPEFTDTVKTQVEHRIELLTLESPEIWRRLETFCEKNKHTDSVGDVDLAYAYRLTEALGRHGDSASRTLAILSGRIDTSKCNAMIWMEPLAIRLAGELRLRDAIGFLISKLNENDDDLVDEEVIRALAMIGGESVLENILNAFPAAPWQFQLAAAFILGNLRADQVSAKCLELHASDRFRDDIHEQLLLAVLKNFSQDGIEPARQWTVRYGGELYDELLAVAILAGVTFPELSEWMDESRRCELRRKHRCKNLFGTPGIPDTSTAVDEDESPEPLTAAPKVGRNDPCPCGSGKKYKKCCLLKEMD
jgi:hypothetical protein